MKPNNKPTWRSSDMSQPVQRRTFTDEEIETQYFVHHSKRMSGDEIPMAGFLVIIEQCDDGYCRCKTPNFTAKKVENGLCAQTLNLWSGSLKPDRLMPPEIAALANQLRKAAL